MSHETNDAQASPGSGAPTGTSLVVHTRARQLLQWLVPALARFPREHRHTVTRHMAALAMQVRDGLIAARHLQARERAAVLRDADMHLDQLRQYGHLALQFRWWSEGHFEHFSRLLEALGRALGGWQRAMASNAQRGGSN